MYFVTPAWILINIDQITAEQPEQVYCGVWRPAASIKKFH